jgi:hypothetical protein
MTSHTYFATSFSSAHAASCAVRVLGDRPALSRLSMVRAGMPVSSASPEAVSPRDERYRLMALAKGGRRLAIALTPPHHRNSARLAVRDKGRHPRPFQTVRVLPAFTQRPECFPALKATQEAGDTHATRTPGIGDPGVLAIGAADLDGGHGSAPFACDNALAAQTVASVRTGRVAAVAGRIGHGVEIDSTTGHATAGHVRAGSFEPIKPADGVAVIVSGLKNVGHVLSPWGGPDCPRPPRPMHTRYAGIAYPSSGQYGKIAYHFRDRDGGVNATS